MIRSNRDWQAWGAVDPYFAVVSEARFRDGANVEEFFQTGRDDFASWLRRCRQLGIPVRGDGTALDFGCGVGRYLAAYTPYFKKTVGLDVAKSMLRHAADNLQDQIASGLVELRHYDGVDLDSTLGSERYDFISANGVLQHVRPAVGWRLWTQLLQHLAPDGVALIQAPYWEPKSPLMLLNRLSYYSTWLYRARRTVQRSEHGFRVTDPPMEVHIYGADRVLDTAAACRVEIRAIDMRASKLRRSNATWIFYRPPAP